jgi:hypothetical protein
MMMMCLYLPVLAMSLPIKTMMTVCVMMKEKRETPAR